MKQMARIWVGTACRFAIVAAVFTAFFGLVWVDADAQSPEEANRAFEEGDFARAVELYRAAIAETPDDARLYFNLGNALSKAGNPDEAEEAYRQFQTRTELAEEQAMADYNLGTAMSERGDLEAAVSHLRNALKRNPGDEDAKVNYEMALKQLQEEQEQQNQDQQDQDQNEDQNQDQQNQDQQQDQNQQNEQDQDQDQQNQQDQQQDQGQQDQQNQQSPPSQGGRSQSGTPEQISKEEAENLLKALEQLEKSILKNRKKAAEEPVTNEKDW